MKFESVVWFAECNDEFDTLKEKLVSTSILVYPYLYNQFHVHVDASGIALGAILMQPCEGTWTTLSIPQT